VKGNMSTCILNCFSYFIVLS